MYVHKTDRWDIIQNLQHVQPPQMLYLTRPQDQETVLDFSQNLFLG